MEESPTPEKEGGTPKPPVDVQRLWPLQSRLVDNLREGKFHEPNEYRGELQLSPYPNRSSSLPPDTSVTKDSSAQSVAEPSTSAQPYVEEGYMTQWMGGVAWVPNPDFRIPRPVNLNPWKDENQYLNFHPSPEREPVRENVHERAAFDKGFPPIKRCYVTDNWIWQWRRIAKNRGVYLKSFDDHPGEVVSGMRHYVEVMGELGFKQQHGGIKLIQTMTCFRGIIIDYSYVAECYDTEEEFVQPEDVPVFHPSTIYNLSQSNFSNNSQMPMPVTTPENNMAPNMIPGAALITYHQHPFRQVSDDLDGLVEVEEAAVDLFHPLPSVDMLRRAFSSLSISTRQILASAANTEQMHSFQHWRWEGNTEHEITAMEHQTFPHYAMGGHGLRSAPATGSWTSSGGISEPENQQLVVARGRRRGGTMFHW